MVVTYSVNRVGLIHMPTTKLTGEILVAAIEGFEAQKRRIDGQIAELRQMLDGGRPKPAITAEPQKRKRRKMSAAGRKAISEATKKRWAAFHAAKEAPKPAVAKKVARKKAAKKAVKSAPVKLVKKTAVKKKAASAPAAAAPVVTQ